MNRKTKLAISLFIPSFIMGTWILFVGIFIHPILTLIGSGSLIVSCFSFLSIITKELEEEKE